MPRCTSCKRKSKILYKRKRSGVAGRYCENCIKGIDKLHKILDFTHSTSAKREKDASK